MDHDSRAFRDDGRGVDAPAGAHASGTADAPDRWSDGSPERPLPPPPTLGEFFDVFRQRLALRHPSFDATRAVLAVTALVAVGGMAWAVWGRAPAGGGDAAAPVRVVTTTTTSTVPASTTSSPPEEVIVDVAGAVVHPGPVRVRAGARVDDAVTAAGGPRDDADLERIDRAAPVTDGERVYVPRRGQSEIPDVVGSSGVPGGGATGAAAAPAGAGAAGGSTAPGGVVDLNTADATALDTLPGVGPATAQAIIDYRSSHGRFTSVDDLLQVKGIGPAKLATLRPHVTV